MIEKCKLHSCEHLVQFYSDLNELIGPLADFFVPWLRAGRAAVLIMTAEHAAALEERLSAADLDLEACRQAGRLVILDARECLGTFMREGAPQEELFAEQVGGLLSGLLARGLSVRAFGEMVDLLWEDGQGLAALELERLWNQLGTMLRFTLFCAYSLQRFSRPEAMADFLEICNQHSQLVPSPVCERVRLLANLQQQILGQVMTGSRYAWGQGTMELAISRLGHFQIDLNRRDIAGSEQFKRHLGLDQDEPVTFPGLSRRVHPDDRVFVENELSYAVSRASDLDLEFRVLAPNGSCDLYALRGGCLEGPAPSMVGVCAKL